MFYLGGNSLLTLILIILSFQVEGYLNIFGYMCVLIDFSLTVKAATLIFISGRGSAIPFAKEGK